MLSVTQAAELIRERRRLVPGARSMLVGISGIDGSGKGYLTARLDALLRDRGVRTAPINVDGWLNLPSKRFDPARPAAHFYESGIRFGAMFSQLVIPLRDSRSMRLTAALADSTNIERFFHHEYRFDDVDVILLEGVFLFRREFRDAFDLALWIDCSFETALERVIARNQEGLSVEELIRDYDTIYYAAQRLHAERDDPRSFAGAFINNDARLVRTTDVARPVAARAGSSMNALPV